MQAPMLQESNYFKTCLKNWQEPCIVLYGAKFKNIDKKESINIPKNAFKIDKYTLIETENVKLTRYINQWPLLILVINVTGISFTDEEMYLENKDLLEEINFPLEDVNLKQRYHLTRVFFCNMFLLDVILKFKDNLNLLKAEAEKARLKNFTIAFK
ncbi:8107_t:CDS:2 [Cetraspora pellucida]|uniref:8107_t:CDS:1 n=1 Tax=Cetraspora pellucida TaxID=1433469 RepID=A0A9N9F048_9GLOM|nr:8107_t:CDS:2 [Cetraspora pellucida]